MFDHYAAHLKITYHYVSMAENKNKNKENHWQHNLPCCSAPWAEGRAPRARPPDLMDVSDYSGDLNAHRLHFYKQPICVEALGGSV